MKGIRVYPDSDSAWLMGWVNKNVFFNGEDEQTMNSDARVMFHYPYTAVTAAMAVTIPGKGSDYGISRTADSVDCFLRPAILRLSSGYSAP